MPGASGSLLLLLGAFTTASPPEAPASYLCQPAYSIDFCRREPLRPYVPQPGDVVLATDHSLFWKLTHNLAGTGHPTHSAIVFARPDGSPAILEAGPHDTMHCRVLDCMPHLRSYEAKGRVWIRPRATPLTAEQSERLSEFALRQDGKWFALQRLGLQLTPFRARGPVRTWWAGKPRGPDRKSYYCAELVVEACVYAGLLDARTARPSATYPRDLFMDASLNPYLDRHLKLAPCWEAPARWLSCPLDR